MSTYFGDKHIFQIKIILFFYTIKQMISRFLNTNFYKSKLDRAIFKIILFINLLRNIEGYDDLKTIVVIINILLIYNW